jgi:micrococcal nuclease
MRFVRVTLTLALLAAACSGDPATPSALSGTLPIVGALPVEAAMPGGQPIDVIAVLDGDSLEAEVDGTVEEIRLLGINTPERQECWSAEARAATATLVEAGTVTLVSAGRDQYGRLLGYIGAGEVFVNARLVAEGHAMAVANEHTFIAEFLSIEQAAFEARSGMWAPDACGRSLGTGMRIDRVDGNPPGRDDDPTTGESIRVRNDGPATVDLEGWTIRDESSVHRYRFPANTTVDAGDTVTVYSVCGRHEHCFGPDTVWSNDGDTALLMDPSGNIVDRVRFAG